ncbi:MAG: zinc ribbon domain-containing protein [Calditrichales bacterium]|nr:MAG: zinc ribbon domain-containing protein [Calditrichales bacterium]
MPIFEFKCNECQHIFEELVFTSNPDPKSMICPECGKKNANKLVSAFSSAGGGGLSMSRGASSCGSSGFG